MNRNADTLTIGQAFAVRWLTENYEKHKEHRKKRRVQPDLPQPEILFEEIAAAVDADVERKVGELHSRLRAVAVQAAEGKEGTTEVTFSANEILKGPALVGVARRWLNTSLSAIDKFPV